MSAGSRRPRCARRWQRGSTTVSRSRWRAPCGTPAARAGTSTTRAATSRCGRTGPGGSGARPWASTPTSTCSRSAPGSPPGRGRVSPALTLHVLPPSHPCMTAEAALRRKGLEYERVALTPGPHNEEMERALRRGPTHRARPAGRRRAGARLARHPRAPRAARARPAALPRADRRRGARGRAVGRRRAPGPRAPAAVGRDALPPRGDGHLRRRRARSIPPGPTSRSATSARRGSTTASPPSAWPRTSPGCRRSSTTSTSSPPTGSIGGEEPTAADLQIGATLRVLLTVGDLRPLIEGRPAAEIARRWFPDYAGEVPAGAFPAGWVPAS